MSEERFRLFVDAVRDYAIFMLDPEGRVTTWNAGAERLKGYRAEEILGQHFSRFYPPEDVAAGKPAMELREAAARGRFEDEGWRVRKDGARFWANVVITALRDPGGASWGSPKSPATSRSARRPRSSGSAWPASRPRAPRPRRPCGRATSSSRSPPTSSRRRSPRSSSSSSSSCRLSGGATRRASHPSG